MVHLHAGDPIECHVISPGKRYCLTISDRLTVFADADKMLEIFNNLGDQLLRAPDGSTDRADIAPVPAEAATDVADSANVLSYTFLDGFIDGDTVGRWRETKIRDNVFHNVPPTIDVPDLFDSMAESLTIPDGVAESYEVNRKEV
jgi:hypothetical protein